MLRLSLLRVSATVALICGDQNRSLRFSCKALVVSPSHALDKMVGFKEGIVASGRTKNPKQCLAYPRSALCLQHRLLPTGTSFVLLRLATNLKSLTGLQALYPSSGGVPRPAPRPVIVLIVRGKTEGRSLKNSDEVRESFRPAKTYR